MARYLELDLATVRPKLNSLARKVRRSVHHAPYVVGTGTSGILYLAEFAHKIKASPIILRKPRVTSHGDKIEMLNENVIYAEVETYLILDDFMSTGRTIKRVLREMKKAFPYSECTGIVLYSNHNSYVALDNDFNIKAFLPGSKKI